jgi:hypothetical protein
MGLGAAIQVPRSNIRKISVGTLESRLSLVGTK